MSERFENSEKSSEDLTQGEIPLQDDQSEEHPPTFQHQLNSGVPDFFDLNIVDDKSLISQQKSSKTQQPESSPNMAPTNQNTGFKSDLPQHFLDISKSGIEEPERNSYFSGRDVQDESFRTAKPTDLIGAGEEEDEEKNVEEKNIDISHDVRRHSFSLGAERMGPSFDGLNLLNWNEQAKNPDTFQRSLELYASHNLASRQVEFGLDSIKEPVNLNVKQDLPLQTQEEPSQEEDQLEEQAKHIPMVQKDESFEKKTDFSGLAELQTDLTFVDKGGEKSIDVSLGKQEENKEPEEKIYEPRMTNNAIETTIEPEFKPNKVQATFETQTCFDDVPTGRIMYPQFKKPVKDTEPDHNTLLNLKEMQTPEEYDRLHGNSHLKA